ncbi:FAD-dependent monooxygenase [Actinokineospora fastidiosa]|uniref:Oxygenase n=1 Tax=Actinokineospora fastidiosa TaxID=1816 RepID=A0A918LJ35_9PSEU|nr:FAD-dependent monooxygenase [Actinokineospora fastidiosa]GGS58642.1 oxygenase [Actinokineospora fastidiosa]
MDVLIVGAGPTGMALACGLAAQGVGVRLVDRATGPAETSRANILHARGVEVLDRLGALGDLRERTLEPAGMRMHVGGRPIATMRFLPDRRERTQALFVSQAAIEAELRRRLTELGVPIHWGTEITSLDQNPRADWVVGCDGARSTVRELAGIAFPGVPVAERFLLADVRADWDRDRSVSAGWYHRDGMLLAMPMPGEPDLWRLMADVPHDGERLAPEQVVDRLRQLLAERAGQSEIGIRETVWASVFRIHRRLAADYRRGRVLLAGDAAHIHSPIGGQGMNTGIGDAENLAWKLGLVVRGLAGPELLDTYGAERRPLAADVLRNTTANTRLLLGETALTRFLRDRVVVPLLGIPAVQRRATRVASQLWVTYRRGPLGGRGPAPRPGDRIPDGEYQRTDGTRTRLHAELGPEWALVGGSAELSAVARTALGEVAWLRGEGDALLIRPDAHLAWRGDDPAALRDRLTAMLRPPGVDTMRP